MPRRRRFGRSALTAAVLASGLFVVAPAAASASWLQQTTVNISSTDTWEFTGVSCASPNNCMAVGVLTATTRQLLSEIRSPSGWTAQPVPEPQAGSVLLGVSCTKASLCIAVGRQPAGSGSSPLAERWNGSNWTIQSTPAPAGATFSELDAVSCISPTRCLAVGDTQSGGKGSGGKQVPLAELWNGSSWKVKPIPKPSGPNQGQSGLSGISCPAQNKCLAVGSSEKNDIFKTLAEAWNGSKWQIKKTPSPAKGDSLNAVSCRSTASCMAVGSGLAERWNGKSWSVVKIAKPRGTAADLLGVSCTKAGPCYAVGGNVADNAQSSVAELWNGSKWSVQPVKLSVSSNSSLLRAVSCTTATNCTAAGFYHDPALGARALAQDFSIRWQDVSPMPFNGTMAAGLNGVSCTSPNACLAVGRVERGGAFQEISQTWDGTGWKARVMPKSMITNLAAVSCTTATACTAVGNIVTGGNAAPLAERWNGVHWTIQKVPHPSGAARSLLTSVSCPTKNSCFAVGFTTNASNQQRTLAERWNGKTWQITPTPNPTRKQEIELASVSCPSVNSCVAVGTVVEGTFAQVWNGKSWKATSAVPNPKNSVQSQLDGVSCPSTGDCIAVGRTFRNSKFVSLAEHWNGKKWSPLKAATPGGVTASQLTGVSCSSANACAAVGIVSGPNAIAESWTGKKWVLHPVDIPAGAMSSVLTRVSCNSAVACMATGQYIDATPTGQMLAEQYS
jgi:hypothetical protein